MSPREPWERRDDETDKAFAAFQTYRDMDPHERSYAAVADDVESSVRWIKQWGSEHDWQARVEAYDDHLDQLRQEATERARARIADHLLELVDEAIEQALDGDTAMLRDLLDRGGLKPDENHNVRLGSADEGESKIDRLLGVESSESDA